MKRIFVPVLIPVLAVLSILLTSACKHDPLADGTPIPPDTAGNGNNNSSGCSKDTTYFVQQVLPIFQSSCAMSGCHNCTTHKKGLILDSYNGILSTGGINVNNPTSSSVYRAMTNSGDENMPPYPAAPMTSTQLALISKWIGQGAKDNSCLESGCDTTNVKYTTHIKPLIQNACQGCHSGASPGGGIELSTYAGIKAIADNGKFFGSISHLSGFSAMPKNGNPLTDCQINMVRIWIRLGATQN